MKPTKAELAELQAIMQSDYGVKVDVEEVEKIGETLVGLFDVILQNTRGKILGNIAKKE